MPDLTDLKMEADVPWIIFFNKEKGIGFAGIQLDYSNSGIESPVRLLNPFFYITAGPWIYWARGLSHTFLSSNMQQVVPVLKGNIFSEKWAYLIYEIDKNTEPYAKVVSGRNVSKIRSECSSLKRLTTGFQKRFRKYSWIKERLAGKDGIRINKGIVR